MRAGGLWPFFAQWERSMAVLPVGWSLNAESRGLEMCPRCGVHGNTHAAAFSVRAL